MDDPRRLVKFETTPLTLGLDVLAALLAILPAAWVLHFWSDLPARVPANFGTGGHVNTWGARASIWFIPVLSILMFLMLLGVVQRTTLYSVPVKLTPQNVHRQLHLARTMVYAMLLWSLVLLAWISWLQIQIALGRPVHFDGVLFVVFIVVEVAILAWYFTAAFRARHG